MTNAKNKSKPEAYKLVSSALGCTTDSLSLSSGMYNHPDWDSFGHLQIILEIERQFEIQISDDEVLKYSSMEEIINLCKKQRG